LRNKNSKTSDIKTKIRKIFKNSEYSLA